MSSVFYLLASPETLAFFRVPHLSFTRVHNSRQVAKPSIFSGGSAGPGQARRSCGADIPVLVARRVHPSLGEPRCSVFEQRLCMQHRVWGTFSPWVLVLSFPKTERVPRTHVRSTPNIRQAHAPPTPAGCCLRCVFRVYCTVV